MTGWRATGTATDPDRLIALYGTLCDANVRRELGLTGRVRRLGRCRLQGVLHDLGPYPALAEGKGVVHGELFELMDGGVLAVMDAYEAFDAARPKLSDYIRVRVRLTDPDVECWIYRYNRPLRGVPRVLGGDWLQHRGRRRSLTLTRPL